jgi:hypothetical protein
MSIRLTFKYCKALMINNPSFRDSVLSWTDMSAEELVSWEYRHFLLRLVDRVLRCGANPN